jgi:hypothetical protein
MASSAPFLRTITLTAANTSYNLDALLRALETNLPQTACMIRLQVDPGAGSATVGVGVAAMSATDRGVSIAAGQVWDLPVTNHAQYVLHDIWLRADTNATKVNCTVLSRF